MKELKHSGRRAFLKTVGGVSLGLPLLELTHGHVFAQEGTARRFLTVFDHGGTISNMGSGSFHDGSGGHHGHDWWKPADPGEALALGPIMRDLEPWKHKLLVLQGIDNKAAIQQHQYRSGGHGIANVTALTAANITSTEDSLSLGPSIDYVLAERLMAAYPTPFERMHLFVYGHQYGSPYFRAASERTLGEYSPASAFATYLEGVTASQDPAPGVARRQGMKRSVVDGLLEGFARFRNVVSRHDLRVVDAHLEHLRALERELQELDLPPLCVPPDAPAATDRANAEVVGPLHVQLILAALRCGLTNVANLEIADILTPWTDAGILMDSAFNIGHSLGHYAREVGATGANAGQLDDWLAETADNRRWRMSLMRQLIEGLDDPAFMEGDGTMLDNSLVLYTSEFSDGANHVSYNVPVLLAGSAGGAFRTGRHINYNEQAGSDPTSYSTQQSTHNLFTSILQAFGGTDGHFGSDHAARQGPLPGLT